jgi:hypothetical protein
MSPWSLVERIGGQLSFHGFISPEGALAYGTPCEVRRTVKETLDVMMLGGH